MSGQVKYFPFAMLALSACASSSASDGADAGNACETLADCEDDGLYCNGDVVCRDNVCAPTEPPNCSDSLACTVDSCSEELLGCLNVPNDDLCDGDLVCVEGEGCAEPTACEFTDDCNDDSFICNGAPECIDNLCTNVPIDCTDPSNDPCVSDDCVEGTGCVNTPYDFMSDVEHCTAACTPCPDPGPLQANVERVCEDGVCGFVCATGYWDLNSSMTDGCEVSCPTDPLTTSDNPDDGFTDTNCDGIDGHFTQIFVSQGGNNGYPGTREQPVQTMAGAFARVTASRNQIYVSEGTYSGRVTLLNGVSIYGGYSHNNNWERSASYTSTISATLVAGSRLTAVEGYSITLPTTFDRMRVLTGDVASSAISNYAFYCQDCDSLTIKNSYIEAGNGGDGGDGGSGSTGTDGVDGVGGFNGTCDGGRGLGGSGGARTCPGSVVVNGGKGGDGGPQGDNDGDPGGTGSNGGGTAGTAGGGCSNTCSGCTGGDGGNGGAGSAAASPTHGTGGSGGSASSGLWIGDAGNNGFTGPHGRGGGGGGGGGGQGGACVDDGGGNGGGGGGSGGCGGGGGFAGSAAGGSFGLFLYNSTGVLLTNNTIQSGYGGTGGSGGGGGLGGQGGLGKNGATNCNDEIGEGGDGRNGSDGAQGGHGGGGSGGPSYAVYRYNTTVSTTGNSLNPSPYAGGNGGTSPGPASSDGAQGADGTVN